MKAPLACPIFWPRLALALGGVLLLGCVVSAEARLWPRTAAFASVARASEIDALAVGDNLRTEERGFVRLAVETCRLQAKLAQLGVAQASRSEVRTFAQELAADSVQIADAAAALARREGVILLPESDVQNPAYVRLTEVIGAEFDREFVLTIAATLDDIMKIFDQTVAEAKDADVESFAASQLPTLRAHQNTIVTLRKALE